ncbi:hypothetical protein FOZ63_016191 [Perkinsus olseni]|uniref:Uncharacterized protein n=1 Tax=Perkinsus olseni TaxID=32597 RepID=A0A7J6RZ99_PEROL|nr:hypothetical protein FOZ63_016191 [Perkinsus olseni]KAF4726007.1 hypothetical protein FOZ62_010881 [Perkinsus olseni]
MGGGGIAAFPPSTKDKESRERVEVFLKDNYSVSPSLPISSSTLDRKFMQTMALTGKDCAKLAARIADQPNSMEIWASAGLEGETAVIISEWGHIRHLVYSEHENHGDWIDEVEKHLDNLSRGILKLGLPMTLSVHVVMHHLLDSLRALQSAGIAPWSVTEEVIESLHGVINRESSASMVKCMARADGIKHLGVMYNAKRADLTRAPQSTTSKATSRPRRSCASYGRADSGSSSDG